MTSSTPADAWDGVATAWDNSVDYIESHSVEATEAMIDAAAVRPGDRVLELAAGPGSLGGRWSELAGASGQVTISDIATGMVDVAQRRNAGHRNVDVAVLDVASIDRPDASFDAVACRMGLMFVPDPGVALAEIRRVLRPGGRLAALTWAGMEHNPWMTCVGMAAMINGLVSGGPPVGPGAIFSLGDPAHLATIATDAGFLDVAVHEFPAVFRAVSIDAHIQRVATLAGPLAAAFAAATPEQLDAVRATASQLAAAYVTDEGVALPGRVLHLTGHV